MHEYEIFPDDEYCLNMNNCSKEEMSALRKVASADNSLLVSSEAVSFPAFSLMNKNLFRNKADHTGGGGKKSSQYLQSQTVGLLI